MAQCLHVFKPCFFGGFLLRNNTRMLLINRKLSIFNAPKCLSLVRMASSALNGSQPEVPVIRMPKYIENNKGKARLDEHKKAKRVTVGRSKATKLDPQHANKLLISSNVDKGNRHYYGYRYDPKNVPLFSRDWNKEKSNGEQIKFHRFDDNPSILKHSEMTFDDLGLEPSIVKAIESKIPSRPSLIQAGAVPLILNNRNVVLSAETGSGKTIAYLAPIIQMIQQHKAIHSKPDGMKRPYGLILLPSRELTEQVGKVAKELSALSAAFIDENDRKKCSVGVATMIGGVPKVGPHTGMDLIVTTIGMVDAHLSKGIYDLSRLNHLVLDEADTLLDDTFADDTMDLLQTLKLSTTEDLTGTQLICCSATVPTALQSTIGNHLNIDEDIDRVTTKHTHSIHPNVKHLFYRLNRYEKELKIFEILKENPKKPTIIFGNRSNGVNWLYHYLNENDYQCVRLTSHMSEEERFHSFNSFQDGEVDILISTDLGSRGLDTARTKHVINYDCPHYVSDYIHRAGRTGRLGQNFLGMVSTMVSFKPDAFMLMELEKAVRLGEEIKGMDANIRSQLAEKWADKGKKFNRNL